MLTILYNSKDGGSVPYTVALQDYRVDERGQLNLVGRLEYNCDKPHLLHMFEALAKALLPSYEANRVIPIASREAKGLNQSPSSANIGAVPPVATPTAVTPNGTSLNVQVAELAKRVSSLEEANTSLATRVSGHDWTVNQLRGTNVVDRVRTLENKVTNMQEIDKRIDNNVINLTTRVSSVENAHASAVPTPVNKLTPVYGSTLINARGYNPFTRTLTVQFLDGNTYSYFDVPRSVWDNFVEAKSAGSYYNANIKGRFTNQQIVKY